MMQFPVNYSSDNASVNSSSDWPLVSQMWTHACTANCLECSSTDKSFEISSLILGSLCPLFVSVIGIPGNILCCLVFWRQGLSRRMNLSLFLLSFVDMAYLLVSLSFPCINLFNIINEYGAVEHYLKARHFTGGVVCALKSASACINMVITVERCLCVLFPLSAASLVKTRTMGIFLGIIVLLTQFALISLPLKFEVNKYKIGGISLWMMVESELGSHYSFVLDPIIYLFSLLIPLITMTVVTAATVVTLIALRAVMTWRKTIGCTFTDQDNEQKALTRMFVGVSVKYIVAAIPFTAVVLIQLISPDILMNYRVIKVYLTCNLVTSLLSLTDSSVNVFIYYQRSARFKQVLNNVIFYRRK